MTGKLLRNCAQAWAAAVAVSAVSAVSVAADGGIYSFQASDLDGKAQSLSQYRGKVLLVVNTASECGYTPQYAGLEKLYEKYRDRGLVVLGFPSNDFGGQEPGSNSQIKYFCQSNYSVKFPLFAKGKVSGSGRQPIFTWLVDHAKTHEEIDWNFEKFLVDRRGEVAGRFKSSVTPESTELTSVLERKLAETVPH